MKAISEFAKALWKDEEGATAVEYGVLVALIIAACVVIIGALGDKIEDAFDQVNTELSESM